VWRRGGGEGGSSADREVGQQRGATKSDDTKGKNRGRLTQELKRRAVLGGGGVGGVVGCGPGREGGVGVCKICGRGVSVVVEGAPRGGRGRNGGGGGTGRRMGGRWFGWCLVGGNKGRGRALN